MTKLGFKKKAQSDRTGISPTKLLEFKISHIKVYGKYTQYD